MTCSKTKLILILIFIIHSQIFNKASAKNTKYYSLLVNVSANSVNSSKKSNKETEELIKKSLLIYHASLEKKLTRNRIDSLHDKAEQELISNLQSLGFYHAKVLKASLTEPEPYKCIADYQINLGLPTLINNINIQLLDKSEDRLLKIIKNAVNKTIVIGQQFSHDNYEKAKQSALTELHNYGFLNAQFITSKVAINLQNRIANINLIVDPKQQYYFGKLSFESDLYENSFLQNYVPFKEHDLYSNKLLMQLKNNLLDSGLFSKVRIDVQDVSKLDKDTVPVIVRVYAKPANKYTGSLGFGTDTGVRGTLGYQRRRKSKPGHSVNITVAAAKIRKQMAMDYAFVGHNPINSKYNFGITAVDDKVKEKFNKNAEIYIQKHKKHRNKQHFWQLSFLTEKFRESSRFNKKNAHFIIPSVNLFWLHKPYNKDQDDYYDESNSSAENKVIIGNKLNLVVKAAAKAIASSDNLLQLSISDKFIYPIMFDLTLIFRSKIGTTFIKNFNKLPISLRYFAGGDDSVRGFGYNSLGPVSRDLDGNQKVVGGKSLFFTSIEIEKPIPQYQQLSFAWFIDLGNALRTFKDLKKNNLALGSGVGVAYKTPVGAIKAYLAKPIKHTAFKDPANKKVRLHLTFTTDLY